MHSLLSSSGLNDIHIPNLGLTETILQKSYADIVSRAMRPDEIDAGIFKKTFLRGPIPNKTLNALIPQGSGIRAFATETSDNGNTFFGQPQIFEFEWNYDEDAIDEFHDLDTIMPNEVDLDFAELEYDYNLSSFDNHGSFELATIDLDGFDFDDKLLAIIKENPEILKYIRYFESVDLELFDFEKFDGASQGDPVGMLQIIDFDKEWDEDVIPDQITENVDLILSLLESLTEPVRDTINEAVKPLGIRFKSKDDISGISHDEKDLDLLQIEFLDDTLIRNNIFKNLDVQPFQIDVDNDNIVELLDINWSLEPEALLKAHEFLQEFAQVKDAISEKFPMKVLQKGNLDH